MAAEDRRHEQDEIDQEQHDQRYDEQRGSESVDAEAFETIGERREQIGDRKACDERQQDLAEQPQRQHDHDERAQPEHHLALEGRFAIGGKFAALTRCCARAHGFATVEFMWRTHSAT